MVNTTPFHNTNVCKAKAVQGRRLDFVSFPVVHVLTIIVLPLEGSLSCIIHSFEVCFPVNMVVIGIISVISALFLVNSPAYMVGMEFCPCA